MAKDPRDLLPVLKSELVFFDAGGYSAWAAARWRLPLVFEESPACPNFNNMSHSTACQDCVFMRLVPLRHRHAPVPCRHIVLDELGQTLEALYRAGTQDELNRVYRRWLVKTIAQLEHKAQRQHWLKDQTVYRAADLT